MAGRRPGVAVAARGDASSAPLKAERIELVLNSIRTREPGAAGPGVAGSNARPLICERALHGARQDIVLQDCIREVWSTLVLAWVGGRESGSAANAFELWATPENPALSRALEGASTAQGQDGLEP